LLHAGLLGWAFFGISMSTPLPQTDEIAVEVAEISMLADVTKQMKGSTESRNNEVAPAPEKPPQLVVIQKEVAKPLPTPPPPPVAEPPPPEPVKPDPPKPAEPEKAAAPTPDDQAKLDEMLAAEETKAKAEAAAKAEKAAAAVETKKKKELADKLKREKELADKKKRDEAEKKRLAELAKQPPKDFTKSMAEAIDGAKAPELRDLTPKPKGAPPASAQTASTNPNAPKGPNAGTATGMDRVNQARAEDMIKAMLRAALYQCWNKPSAGGGVAAPAVTLEWVLKADGSLKGEPKIVKTDRNSPLADQAERAAIRAVQTCAPFKLPPDLFKDWEEVQFTFNPNKAM
jgi:TolA protein